MNLIIFDTPYTCMPSTAVCCSVQFRDNYSAIFGHMNADGSLKLQSITTKNLEQLLRQASQG